MFGFASNETEGFQDLQGMFMPLPAALAQLLTSKMSASMKDGSLPWARPDSKVRSPYDMVDDGKPSSVDTVVIAIQHDDLAKEKFEGSEREEHSYICSEVMEHVIETVIPTSLLDKNTKIIINGTGRFVLGGPHADAGLTGRKIIVDTYGGMGRHGGGLQRKGPKQGR